MTRVPNKDRPMAANSRSPWGKPQFSHTPRPESEWATGTGVICRSRVGCLDCHKICNWQKSNAENSKCQQVDGILFSEHPQILPAVKLLNPASTSIMPAKQPDSHQPRRLDSLLFKQIPPAAARNRRFRLPGPLWFRCAVSFIILHLRM